MWSLPNIVAMNAATEAPENQAEIARQMEHPEELQCQVCEWKGDKTPAEVAYETFTIYSDKPDGVIALCEKHDGYTGSPMEGYFTCDSCFRVFSENITWEMHFVIDDGGIQCINCARKEYLADESNWIDLDSTEQLMEAARFENVRRAKHLFAVDQDPAMSGLRLVGNVEYDSMDGHSISGARDMGDLLEMARMAGASRAVMILDGAYQFAVSIGVYVELDKEEVPNAR
jgi:hypothetical protein